MSEGTMFELPEARQIRIEPPTLPREARVVRPKREQVEWVARNLEEIVPQNHAVRAIWEFLEGLDLSAFYAKIKATLERPGRPASDPRVLLALWIYATSDGVGSARRLAKLCQEHDAYRWLCGGVPVDYHLLAEFRVSHEKALNRLLSEIVATLMAHDLVKLRRVAQDGVRVRAKAGLKSFRGGEKLEKCLAEAEAQVQRLALERDHPGPEVNQRKQAAKERAAKERAKRVRKALSHLPAIQAARERQVKRGHKRVREAQASTTDAEARMMKMPDGGVRPAYNIQLATDLESQVVVGVAVSNSAADQGQASGMERQVAERTGKHPETYLLDKGYVDLDDVVALEGAGVAVHMPPQPRRVPGDGPGKKVKERMGRQPGIRHWWERMQTEEGKKLYRDRGKTEAVNGLTRERYGIRRFLVAGQDKVLCIALLVAVTHDVLRSIALN